VDRSYCASTMPLQGYPLAEILPALPEAGFTAVELAIGHLDGLSASAAAELQGAHGVKFRSLLSTDDIMVPGGRERLADLVETAGRLAIPMVSIPSGGAEKASDESMSQCIDRLANLARQAEGADVRLGLYAHEGSIGYSLARVTHILDAIPSSALGFYYSGYHFHRAGDSPVEALGALAGRLCNVYFNCGVDPGGEGEPFWAPEMDLPAVCDAIARVGYDEEIMLIYLGLDAKGVEPVVDGLARARTALDAMFS
jgi:sugar phosphate isomerase/epimerase